MNNDNGINKYNSYIEDRKINRKLILWSGKLFRILNFVGGSIFIISGISSVVSYMLLTSSLTSVALAVNTLLPFCVSSFFVSTISGGALVVVDIILCVNKVVLELNGKRLNKKISSENLIEENKINLELAKDNGVSKNNDEVLQKKYFYQYMPSKNRENDNVVETNNNSKVKKRTLIKK